MFKGGQRSPCLTLNLPPFRSKSSHLTLFRVQHSPESSNIHIRWLKPIWNTKISNFSQVSFHVLPRLFPFFGLYHSWWTISFFLREYKKEKMVNGWRSEALKTLNIEEGREVTEGMILKEVPASRMTSRSSFLSLFLPSGTVTLSKWTRRRNK